MIYTTRFKTLAFQYFFTAFIGNGNIFMTSNTKTKNCATVYYLKTNTDGHKIITNYIMIHDSNFIIHNAQWLISLNDRLFVYECKKLWTLSKHTNFSHNAYNNNCNLLHSIIVIVLKILIKNVMELHAKYLYFEIECFKVCRNKANIILIPVFSRSIYIMDFKPSKCL